MIHAIRDATGVTDILEMSKPSKWRWIGHRAWGGEKRWEEKIETYRGIGKLVPSIKKHKRQMGTSTFISGSKIGKEGIRVLLHTATVLCISILYSAVTFLVLLQKVKPKIVNYCQ